MTSDISAKNLVSTLKKISQSLGELASKASSRTESTLAIEVLFGLMGLLARIDSIVTSHETQLVNGLMNELKLSIGSRKLALDAFERGRKNEISLDSELDRFLNHYSKGTTEAAQLFDSLVRLAAIDGRLRPREKDFLSELTTRLGYTPDLLANRLEFFSIND
jgi:DnaJ like chaperone protein